MIFHLFRPIDCNANGRYCFATWFRADLSFPNASHISRKKTKSLIKLASGWGKV